jgi:hypothetical protein
MAPEVSTIGPPKIALAAPVVRKKQMLRSRDQPGDTFAAMSARQASFFPGARRLPYAAHAE